MLPSVVGAVVAALLAAGVYWVAVWTPFGQRVDQYLLELCRNLAPVTPVPAPLDIAIVTNPLLWVAAAVAAVLLALSGRLFGGGRMTGRAVGVTAALLAFAPLASLGARILRDNVLERPTLHSWIAETGNSAPSGHAAAVTSCAVILVAAAPPWLRPMVAIIAGTWAATIEFVLVAEGWHRPSDVVISTLLVVGAGLLLPDPHADAPRGRSVAAGRLLVPVGVTVAMPVLVAVYYPHVGQIVVAALIGAVMGVALGLYLPAVYPHRPTLPDPPMRPAGAPFPAYPAPH